MNRTFSVFIAAAFTGAVAMADTESRVATNPEYNQHCTGDLYFEDFAVTGVYLDREKPFDFLTCLSGQIRQYNCQGLEAFLNNTFDLYSQGLNEANRAGADRLKDKWLGQIGPVFEEHCLRPLLISAATQNLNHG